MKILDQSFPIENLLLNENYTIIYLLNTLKENDFDLIQFYSCWILASLLVSEKVCFEKILYEKGIFHLLFAIITKKPNLPLDNNKIYVQILYVGFRSFFWLRNHTF